MKENKSIKYPSLDKLLKTTQFNFSVDKTHSNKKYTFIKVNFAILNKYLTYYISVPTSDEYIKTSKAYMKNLIDSKSFTKYIIKIIPYWEIEEYACRL